MKDLRYEEVEFVSHQALKNEVESGDPARISGALHSASRYEEDWKWTQDQCLRFLRSGHVSVRWAAATCLGDLAMFKRPIEGLKVLEALVDARQDTAIIEPVEFSIGLVKEFSLHIN
jgi:hypothetical protein